jgi:tetratricopeptide (TPR) repeat protein
LNALSYGARLSSPFTADEPLTGVRVGDRQQAADAAFHIGLADAADAEGRSDLATQHLREAVRLAPNDVTARRRLALAAAMDGDVETALACSALARELAPADLAVAAVHATVLEAVGRTGEAWEIAHQVIRANWCSTHLAATFAKLAPHHGQAPLALRVLEAMIARPTIRPDYRMHLQFAAGDLLDRMGRYDEAFAYYRQANQAKDASFDPAAHSTWTDEMIAAFSPDRWRAAPRAAEASELPVFIVGMPRSGTTLVEQILATHPAVQGLGELSLISDLLSSLPRLVPGAATLADYVERVAPAAVGQLSADYLAALRTKTAGAPAGDVTRVTDKNPINFLHLGWAGLMLPKARIVHCVRSPLDTCLSCFATHFGDTHDYAYDLNHLGRFYRDYRRLMDHWRSLPDGPAILDVSYEAVVADPEGQTRRLLDFAGLPWDDRCLRFHENPRYVHTTSYSQVRQPLYASSVGRWRNYAGHLTPLRDALADMAE